jgi:phage terminase large subunit-like protein
MTKKTTVVDVSQAPQLSKPDMLSGIRDRAAAEAWGQKHGYVIVYFMPKKQRVYAERMLDVAEQAAALDRRSAELARFAEDGSDGKQK